MTRQNFYEKISKLTALSKEISEILSTCTHEAYKRVIITDPFWLSRLKVNYRDECMLCGKLKEHILEDKLSELKLLTTLTEEQLKEIK